MNEPDHEKIEAKARLILRTWRKRADPVAELDALAENADPRMAGFFAMMASDLARAMNTGAADDPA